MKTNEYMEQAEQYVLHTYNRFPLVIWTTARAFICMTPTEKHIWTLRQVSRYMRSATAMTIIKKQ